MSAVPANRLLFVVISFGTLLCLPSVCHGRTATFNLGGLRNPVVTVKEGHKGYDISAHFVAVDAFDIATNQKLNREKGRGFALIALARFMGLANDQGITVVGLVPTRMLADEQLIEIGFRVDKVDVQKTAQPGGRDAESTHVAEQRHDHGGEAAEAVENDYRDTIRIIDDCGRGAAADLIDGPGDLYEEIAHVENATLDLFDIVRRQVRENGNLAQKQRSRLYEDVDQTQRDFLTTLKVELQILEASAE